MAIYAVQLQCYQTEAYTLYVGSNSSYLVIVSKKYANILHYVATVHRRACKLNNYKVILLSECFSFFFFWLSGRNQIRKELFRFLISLSIRVKRIGERSRHLQVLWTTQIASHMIHVFIHVTVYGNIYAACTNISAVSRGIYIKYVKYNLGIDAISYEYTCTSDTLRH